jgi:hypothetical protein
METRIGPLRVMAIEDQPLPIIRRLTKLYVFYLVLAIFTIFTFGADLKVHPRDWHLFNNRLFERREETNCDPATDDLCAC